MRRAALILALATAAAFLVGCSRVAPAGDIPGQDAVVVMHCQFVRDLQVDPIVSPGITPSAHMHAFFANTTVDQFSTPNSLVGQPSNCSTAGDTAGEWMPKQFFGTQASVENVGVTHVGEYWANDGRSFVNPPPFGMEFVAGNAHATSPTDPIENAEVDWHCQQSSAVSTQPIDCTGLNQGPVKMEVFFPNCYDGTLADPTTGIIAASHFVYAGSLANHFLGAPVCPTGFVPIAQLQFQVDLYNATTFYYDPFAPDGSVLTNFASGPWYTLHVDFIQSWNQTALANLINGCLNGIGSCPPHS